MTEFRYWVIIVSLLIFLNFVTWMGLVYIDRKIKKSEVILQRAEQVEKKNAKPRIDPKPDDSDGM